MGAVTGDIPQTNMNFNEVAVISMSNYFHGLLALSLYAVTRKMSPALCFLSPLAPSLHFQ